MLEEKTVGALRKSALQLAVFFAVIASISWWRGHFWPPAVLGTFAGILTVLSVVAPRAFGPIERVLIVAGEKIGAVMNPLVLGSFYYLVVTPIGFIIRLKRDPLNRKIPDGLPSNWIKRTERPTVESYRQQF